MRSIPISSARHLHLQVSVAPQHRGWRSTVVQLWQDLAVWHQGISSSSTMRGTKDPCEGAGADPCTEMSRVWVHWGGSSCGNCKPLSPPKPNRQESEAPTLWYTAPSSALLNPTVQTWLGGIDELPAACASARDQTQLYISIISGKISFWKISCQCNQSYSLAEEGLRELLWCLSRGKLDGVIRKITSSIKICRASASQAHGWTPGPCFLSVSDRTKCTLIICGCKNPFLAESRKPFLSCSFIRV